jgi:hypothetical protein
MRNPVFKAKNAEKSEEGSGVSAEESYSFYSFPVEYENFEECSGLSLLETAVCQPTCFSSKFFFGESSLL